MASITCLILLSRNLAQCLVHSRDPKNLVEWRDRRDGVECFVLNALWTWRTWESLGMWRFKVLCGTSRRHCNRREARTKEKIRDDHKLHALSPKQPSNSVPSTTALLNWENCIWMSALVLSCWQVNHAHTSATPHNNLGWFQGLIQTKGGTISNDVWSHSEFAFLLLSDKAFWSKAA